MLLLVVCIPVLDEGSKKPFLVPSTIPISAAFDFLAAFPSVIHDWIWAVLSHRKLPIHFINFFKANYHDAKAVFTHNGTKYFSINFLSGVLQRCPGSAILFNNAIDPFLFKIHIFSEPKMRGWLGLVQMI